MRTFLDAKLMAKTLRQALSERRIELKHADCLELVAHQFGFADRNVLAARLGEVRPDHAPLKLPKGWIMTGPAVNGSTHRLGLDPTMHGTALIESILPCDGSADLDNKIAVLMQSISAESYVGQRVKLSAQLRVEAADAGTIWLRVDSTNGKSMRFDNMMNRDKDESLTGTQDWTPLNIVLDVSEGAESIHFGFFLKGYGRVRARAFRLEPVGGDIAETATHGSRWEAPRNLDFSEAA